MKYGALFLSFFIILGCYSMGDQRVSEKGNIDQIKIGVSTKADIKALFGEPNHVTFGDKEEMWMYMYTRLVTRPTTFIPVVGLFAGGSDMKSNTLTVMFNKEGVVTKFGPGHYSGGGGSIAD
ncbi:MAG: outer membrane protein assembly factor BamE [Deltaproteobacteria bacterium]|nr:MAG: outer membrane protein assembly factor BamE [Deltaproteobacteria bacterium]